MTSVPPCLQCLNDFLATCDSVCGCRTLVLLAVLQSTTNCCHVCSTHFHFSPQILILSAFVLLHIQSFLFPRASTSNLSDATHSTAWFLRHPFSLYPTSSSSHIRWVFGLTHLIFLAVSHQAKVYMVFRNYTILCFSLSTSRSVWHLCIRLHLHTRSNVTR